MNAPASLRLAVFDCDGTLIDSQRSIFAAVSAAFESCGLEAPLPQVARRVIGLPLIEAIAALVPVEVAAGVDTALLTERYKDAFLTLRARPDFEEPLFPGTEAALDALEDAGYLLGVATSKGRQGLERTLERHGLLRRFVTLQTGDSGPGKPHPEMLERAMAETGVVSEDCVMIGDTTYDMRMARAAKAKALGVSWGYHAAEELAAAGAEMIVNSFSELPSAVRALVP